MEKNSGKGIATFAEDRTFNAVRVFSATMVQDRSGLGDVQLCGGDG